MRKAGIEITLAWMEQYPSINSEALGAFIKLSTFALKHYEGCIPETEDLEYISGVSGVNLELAKSMFVLNDGVFHIPDTLKHKTFGKETRKPKHVRKDIDMSLYSTEQIASYNKFINWLNGNAPRVQQLQKPFTIQEYLTMVAEGWSADSIKKILIDMHNWKPLLQKNVSAFLTLSKWLRHPNSGAIKANKTFDGPTTKTGQQIDIHNKVKEALEKDGNN